VCAVTATAADQEIVPEHHTKPMEGAGHRRLADRVTLRGARDVPFLEQHRQRLQEIQIAPAYMLIAYCHHHTYALDRY
jgi:hypothetical protein